MKSRRRDDSENNTELYSSSIIKKSTTITRSFDDEKVEIILEGKNTELTINCDSIDKNAKFVVSSRDSNCSVKFNCTGVFPASVRDNFSADNVSIYLNGVYINDDIHRLRRPKNKNIKTRTPTPSSRYNLHPELFDVNLSSTPSATSSPDINSSIVSPSRPVDQTDSALSNAAVNNTSGASSLSSTSSTLSTTAQASVLSSIPLVAPVSTPNNHSNISTQRASNTQYTGIPYGVSQQGIPLQVPNMQHTSGIPRGPSVQRTSGSFLDRYQGGIPVPQAPSTQYAFIPQAISQGIPQSIPLPINNQSNNHTNNNNLRSVAPISIQLSFSININPNNEQNPVSITQLNQNVIPTRPHNHQAQIQIPVTRPSNIPLHTTSLPSWAPLTIPVSTPTLLPPQQPSTNHLPSIPHAAHPVSGYTAYLSWYVENMKTKIRNGELTFAERLTSMQSFLNLSDDDIFREFHSYLCAITKEPAEIPVLLNGATYDFQSLDTWFSTTSQNPPQRDPLGHDGPIEKSHVAAPHIDFLDDGINKLDRLQLQRARENSNRDRRRVRRNNHNNDDVSTSNIVSNVSTLGMFGPPSRSASDSDQTTVNASIITNVLTTTNVEAITANAEAAQENSAEERLSPPRTPSPTRTRVSDY